MKPYDERDRRSIEEVMPNNPNHKGFKVGQKHHDGNKYIVEQAFNEATSPESATISAFIFVFIIFLFY